MSNEQKEEHGHKAFDSFTHYGCNQCSRVLHLFLIYCIVSHLKSILCCRTLVSMSCWRHPPGRKFSSWSHPSLKPRFGTIDRQVTNGHGYRYDKVWYILKKNIVINWIAAKTLTISKKFGTNSNFGSNIVWSPTTLCSLLALKVHVEDDSQRLPNLISAQYLYNWLSNSHFCVEKNSIGCRRLILLEWL